MNKLRIIATVVALCAVISVSAADKQYEVVKIAHDATHLYLGTKEHGLIIVDKLTGRQTFLNKENGRLKENHIRDIKTFGSQVAFIETRANRSSPSWVEFMENGQVTKSVEVKAPMTGVPEALAGNFGFWICPSIAFDGAGQLWLTINDSWICRCEGDTFTDFVKVVIDHGFNWMITDMVFDDQGVLWLANNYPDSLLCKCHDGQVEKFDLQGWTFCIAIDSQGNKWLGGDLLSKYDGEEMTFYKGRGGTDLSDMAFDSKGRLWGMEQYRLLRFTGPATEGANDCSETLFTPSGKRYHYETGTFEEYQLPINGLFLNCIHVDGNRLYVAGNQGRLLVIDITTDVCSMVLLSDEANSIESILQQPDHQSDAFDLQGRRLPSPPARGVYIQDGKKVIAE